MLSFLWKVLVEVNRTLTVLTYPLGLVFCTLNFQPPSIANARFFWQVIFGTWLPVTVIFRYQVWYAGWSWPLWALANFIWLWAWDIGMIAFGMCSYCTEILYLRKTSENRLTNKNANEKPKFLGPKIVVLGNGPSLAKDTPHGKLIDSMDEVIRFNNFQTKVSKLEAWTGTKTTVHFSDSMLYPSYPEYKVPGATIILSLFMDRLMVSGSYFLFRVFIDLSIREALQLMFDPAVGWLSHDDIHNLKERVGISKWKHPTSGCLAIDWFVRHRPDPSIPVYIHGFDFFQGGEVHYYSKTEPLYERLNDLLGVTVMHEPAKERAYVDMLVKEGKVKWLRADKL